MTDDRGKRTDTQSGESRRVRQGDGPLSLDERGTAGAAPISARNASAVAYNTHPCHDKPSSRLASVPTPATLRSGSRSTSGRSTKARSSLLAKRLRAQPRFDQDRTVEIHRLIGDDRSRRTKRCGLVQRRYVHDLHVARIRERAHSLCQVRQSVAEIRAQ